MKKFFFSGNIFSKKVDPPPPFGTLTKIKIFFFESFDVVLLLASIFVVNLPPFIFGSPLINTHLFAKLVWAFLAIKNFKYLHKNNTLILLLFAFYFFSISLSIINAINIIPFLKRYEDIIASGFFLVAFVSILNKQKVWEKLIIERLALILVLCAFINVMWQYVIYFFPYKLSLYTSFLRPDLISHIIYNVSRNRIFYEDYLQSFIPFIFYYLERSQKSSIYFKIFLYFLLINITILSVLSNNRTFFLMLLFSLFFSLLIMKEKSIKLLLILSTVFTFIISLIVNNYKYGTNIIDRFLQTRTAWSTIAFRLNMWSESFLIGISNILTGVGLDNYINYLPTKYFLSEKYSFKSYFFDLPLAVSNPHNIFFQYFSEVGIIGLTSLIFLLLYFAKTDLSILRNSNNNLAKYYMVAYYCVLIFALLNPAVSIRFYVLLWLYRFSIEAIREKVI